MKPVVFDLDGTLIDSAPQMHAAVNAMLADEGRAPLDLAEITSFIGNGLPHLVQLVIKARELEQARHKTLTADVLGHFMGGNGALTTLYPNVREMLQALHRDGHALGICTNKPIAPAHEILRHFGLSDLFGAVIGGDSLEQRKPHPAPLLATFQALGAVGIYVGDSEVDAETAQRAGVPFALYTEGYRKSPLDKLPHDWAFGDFSALPEIISSSRDLAAG